MKTPRKPHTLKQNDILVSTWGYEQTNVDFYIVTRVVSEKSVVICQIGAKEVVDGHLHGHATPDPTILLGEPRRKIVDGEKNTIKLTNYSRAYLWKGDPIFWSSWH